MKKFAGQHKNEKTLYCSRENLICYISRYFNFVYVMIGILIFIIFFSYFFGLTGIFFLIIVYGYILISLFLFFFFWYKTFFIATNKRVIKYIRSGIFSEYTKELKIDQINELTVSKVGIMAKLFRFGNIKITGQHKENVIWVKGISHPYEVIQYISRIRDYCLENPGYDYNSLNKFKLRKERKAIKEDKDSTIF